MTAEHMAGKGAVLSQARTWSAPHESGCHTKITASGPTNSACCLRGGLLAVRALRRWLATRRVTSMQLDTLRLRLLKIGGRVSQLRDRARLRLAASHPGRLHWDHGPAYQRLHE